MRCGCILTSVPSPSHLKSKSKPRGMTFALNSLGTDNIPPHATGWGDLGHALPIDPAYAYVSSSTFLPCESVSERGIVVCRRAVGAPLRPSRRFCGKILDTCDDQGTPRASAFSLILLSAVSCRERWSCYKTRPHASWRFSATRWCLDVQARGCPRLFVHSRRCPSPSMGPVRRHWLHRIDDLRYVAFSYYLQE